MEKFCKSCGMPMDKQEDFANNDKRSNYCYYCGDKPSIYNKGEHYDNQVLEKEEYYNKKENKSKAKKKKIVKKTTKKKVKKKK